MVEEDSRILEILNPNLPPNERLQAFNEFKASGDTMPSDILEKVLLIADVQLRESALEFCDRQQETVSSKVGRALLYDSSPDLRVRAIPCLGRTDKQKGESFLQQMALSDPREDIRAQALQEIRDSKIAGAASALLLRLQELIVYHASVSPDQALPDARRNYMFQLIRAQGDLGNLDAKPDLMSIAKAAQVPLLPLRGPAVRALLDLGEAIIPDVLETLDHYLQLWPGEDFAAGVLDRLKLFPRRPFIPRLLDIAAGVVVGPAGPAQSILVDDGWFAIALPVVATSLASENRRESCEAILEHWLSNEQLRESVYLKLASQRGEAKEQAAHLVVRTYSERQLSEGSEAVARIAALVVPCLGKAEEQFRTAETVLDLLLEGAANRPTVYGALLDRANAKGPLRERIENFLLSRLRSYPYAKIADDLINRISDAKRCPSLRAARYTQLLSRWGSQSYASDTAEPSRKRWLDIAAKLMKHRRHRVKHAGGQLLDGLFEAERKEFVHEPLERTLAQHPVVRELWRWTLSDAKSLKQQAKHLLEGLEQDPHHDPCFACFVLVSGIENRMVSVRGRALELLAKHQGLTDAYRAQLVKQYETEAGAETRYKSIQVMHKNDVSEFVPVAHRAVQQTHRPTEERIALMDYLVAIEHVSSPQILHKLLADPTVEIRRAAVRALEKIGHASSVEPLNNAKKEGSAPSQELDSALTAIFLRNRDLLSADQPTDTGKGLELWKQIAIRVEPAMEDLANILVNDGSPENRILAAQLYAIPGLGRKSDLPLLEERFSSEIESVKIEIKKAIMTIRETRDFGFEEQLKPFEEYYEHEDDWPFLQVSYPDLGEKTLRALSRQLGKFHRQSDPSAAIMRLNNACEALTKRLFEQFGDSVWQVDELLLKRLLSKKEGQYGRLNWMEGNLADIDLTHFRYIDDLRRESDAAHEDEEKREIYPDELEDAKTEFVKALLWTIRACNDPPKPKPK